MMARRFVAVFSLCVVIAASIAACRTNNYELELQPDGDTIQRKVSMWTFTNQDGVRKYIDFDTGTLQHVSQIYDATMPTNLAQRHEFEGQFERRLPDDIGDGGWYLRQTSMMGSVNVYVEHAEGGRKISWDLDTRQKSLHRLVDVWLVWLESEFGDDERYLEVHEFVDGIIRDDLLNIAIYLWGYDMFGSVGRRESDSHDEIRLATDVFFRIAIYLAERDYFDPEELPELVQRALASAEEEQPGLIWSFMLRALAMKSGTAPEKPLPWPLSEFDEDPAVFVESVKQFVAESAEIRAMAEVWEQAYWDSLTPSERAYRREIDEMEDILEVEVPPRDYVIPQNNKSMLSQLVEMAFASDLDFIGFGHSSSFVHVILHVPQEPLSTNGKWEKDNTVRWNNNISSEGSWGDRLPNVFYAVWAAPAVEFQEEHFGKLVLEGEDLVEHVGWYLTLDSGLMQEWDAFQAKLKPGPELITKLQNFCFSSELPECATKRPPAAPSHRKMAHGGYSVTIPQRSSIARRTIREIVRALVPEPELSDKRSDATE